MNYIDGFVIPVPVKNKDAYIEIARIGRQVFLDHGAIEVVETWGDDLKHGNVTDFYRAVNAEENEGVVFSWVLWPSKEARDAGNAKVMTDPRMQMSGQDMPFEGKRLIYGGFEVLPIE